MQPRECTCDQYGFALVRNIDGIGRRVPRCPKLRPERRHCIDFDNSPICRSKSSLATNERSAELCDQRKEESSQLARRKRQRPRAGYCGAAEQACNQQNHNTHSRGVGKIGWILQKVWERVIGDRSYQRNPHVPTSYRSAVVQLVQWDWGKDERV